MAAVIVADLKLPSGVEMVQTKTSVKFIKGSKKAYLKGSNLEVTSAMKSLGSRVKSYSADVIDKCHLGLVCACVPNIADTVDCQKILNRYFKTK